jgi:hypothetical protein
MRKVIPVVTLLCLSTSCLLAAETDKDLLSSSPSKKLVIDPGLKNQLEGILKQQLEAAFADLETFLNINETLPITDTSTKKTKSTKTDKSPKEQKDKRKRALSTPEEPKLIRQAAIPGMTSDMLVEMKSTTLKSSALKRKSTDGDEMSPSPEGSVTSDISSGSSPVEEDSRSPIASPRKHRKSAPEGDLKKTVESCKDTLPDSIRKNIIKMHEDHLTEHPEFKHDPEFIEKLKIASKETETEIEVEINHPARGFITLKLPSLRSLFDPTKPYGLDLKRIDLRENILRENDLNRVAEDVAGLIINFMDLKEKLKYIEAIYFQLREYQKSNPELSAQPTQTKDSKEKKKPKVSKRQKEEISKFSSMLDDIKQKFIKGTWTPEHTKEFLEGKLQAIMTKLPGIEMESLMKLPSKKEAEIILGYELGIQTRFPSIPIQTAPRA